MHILNYEIAKFSFVGAANFVLTFIIFFLLFKVLKINYLIALSTTWAFGMVFTYAFNFSWVFRPEQQLNFRVRFMKYFLASLASIGLNLLALRCVVERTHYDPFYVQTALIPFILIFNFTTSKFWSLKPREKHFY